MWKSHGPTVPMTPTFKRIFAVIGVCSKNNCKIFLILYAYLEPCCSFIKRWKPCPFPPNWVGLYDLFNDNSYLEPRTCTPHLPPSMCTTLWGCPLSHCPLMWGFSPGIHLHPFSQELPPWSSSVPATALSPERPVFLPSLQDPSKSTSSNSGNKPSLFCEGEG